MYHHDQFLDTDGKGISPKEFRACLKRWVDVIKVRNML